MIAGQKIFSPPMEHKRLAKIHGKNLVKLQKHLKLSPAQLHWLDRTLQSYSDVNRYVRQVRQGLNQYEVELRIIG